jgi:hypothetical protein
MVFNTTFYNILEILWRSVLLVEEIPGENHLPVASLKAVSSTPRYKLSSNSQLQWWYLYSTVISIATILIQLDFGLENKNQIFKIFVC